MMNGDEFIDATDGKFFYTEACMKLVIYAYNRLRASKRTFSRAFIQKEIRDIQVSHKALNEIEDYLCDDLVNKYMKPNKHLFGLSYHTINTGVKESERNVKVGILDIKIEQSNLVDNTYFIIEAKRLDKYSTKQEYYITGGIKRFTDRTYYPESDVRVAGMIGFVEVDLTKFKKGRVPVKNIIASLNRRIKSNTQINTSQVLKRYPIADENYPEVNDFQYSYQSKHLRDDDKEVLTIHHLLFDYYDILEN